MPGFVGDFTLTAAQECILSAAAALVGRKEDSQLERRRTANQNTQSKLIEFTCMVSVADKSVMIYLSFLSNQVPASSRATKR